MCGTDRPETVNLRTLRQIQFWIDQNRDPSSGTEVFESSAFSFSHEAPDSDDPSDETKKAFQGVIAVVGTRSVRPEVDPRMFVRSMKGSDRYHAQSGCLRRHVFVSNCLKLSAKSPCADCGRRRPRRGRLHREPFVPSDMTTAI
jgi:hypothetical protein